MFSSRGALLSSAVTHSFLWSQFSPIINLPHSTDDADQSCQIPGEKLSGVFSQGFAAGFFVTPHVWVINKAGESRVWPQVHLGGQEVRDRPLGRRLLAVQDRTLTALWFHQIGAVLNTTAACQNKINPKILTLVKKNFF